jgi:hypothetical protein
MPIAGPTYAFANIDSYITLADLHVAQSFIVTGGNRGLHDFTVQLRKQGSPTGNLHAVLYDDDGSGKPNSPVENGVSPTLQLASGISGAGAQYTFDFSASPPFLLNNAKYHIVLLTDADWDGTNYLEFGVDGSSPSFADGNINTFANGASIWTEDLTRDAAFSSQYSDTTPDAPVDTIDLQWTCDCNNQDEVVESNLSIINDLKTVMVNLLRPIIEVYSPYFPSQGNWESEWLKLGNSLPIPDGTNLLWYDTFNNKFGGRYTFVNGQYTEIIYKLPKGSQYGLTRPSVGGNMGVNLSTTFGTGTNGNIVFDTSGLLVPSHLRFNFNLYAGGTVAWNYLINSVNQYNTEFGTALNTDAYGKFVGPALPAFSSFQIRWQHYQVVNPGAFPTFQLLFVAAPINAQWQAYIAPVSTTPASAILDGFGTYYYLSSLFYVVA